MSDIAANADDWEQHWRENARSNARNPAQAYRQSLIFGALGLEHAPAPIRLLEIGCGQGTLSALISSRYPALDLLGLDLSHTGLEKARVKVPRATFFQQDLREPLAIPQRYRAWATHAVCSEVLEHLDDPLRALRNVRACFAPGAKLVITVPAGPMSAYDRHIGHRAHFTCERLEQLLQDAGLALEAVHGAGFPFFNLYRLSVIARGEQLIADASGTLPPHARAAMWAFGQLFRLNAQRGARGWQLLAIAREPE